MWDIVAFTVRHQEPRKAEIEQEFDFLQKSGVFSTDLFLIVEDFCEDIGSGGATLNALRVLIEKFSSTNSTGRPFPAMEILSKARILILHSAKSDSTFPLGPAFLRLDFERKLKNGKTISEMPIVQLFENAECLAENQSPMVWVLGTESYWKVDKKWMEWRNWQQTESERSFLAFSFQASDQLADRHGVYTCDRDRFVEDIHYRDRPMRSFHLFCLSAFCFPPEISLALLTIPIEPGIQLNFFFDFILAGCKNWTEFSKKTSISGKSERKAVKLEKSPQIHRLIHENLGKYRTRVEFIPATHFHHFHVDDEANWSELLTNLKTFHISS